MLFDLDDFARAADAVPGHVGDVQQAVDAAEVHEGAELGDVLHDAHADLARFDLGHELLLQLVALIFEELRRETTMLWRASSILRILH